MRQKYLSNPGLSYFWLVSLHACIVTADFEKKTYIMLWFFLGPICASIFDLFCLQKYQELAQFCKSDTYLGNRKYEKQISKDNFNFFQFVSFEVDFRSKFSFSHSLQKMNEIIFLISALGIFNGSNQKLNDSILLNTCSSNKYLVILILSELYLRKSHFNFGGKFKFRS